MGTVPPYLYDPINIMIIGISSDGIFNHSMISSNSSYLECGHDFIFSGDNFQI
jgi:hypothetical protein